MINFTNTQLKRLLQGLPVRLTELKKEREFFTTGHSGTGIFEGGGSWKYRCSIDYPVTQNGKTVWYCPKCKKLTAGANLKLSHAKKCNIKFEEKPLRFIIQEIRAEKLFDITEEEAERAGFPCQEFPSPSRVTSFLWWFHAHNKLKTINGAFQNPSVWVLIGGKKE